MSASEWAHGRLRRQLGRVASRPLPSGARDISPFSLRLFPHAHIADTPSGIGAPPVCEITDGVGPACYRPANCATRLQSGCFRKSAIKPEAQLSGALRFRLCARPAKYIHGEIGIAGSSQAQGTRRGAGPAFTAVFFPLYLSARTEPRLRGPSEDCVSMQRIENN